MINHDDILIKTQPLSQLLSGIKKSTFKLNIIIGKTHSGKTINLLYFLILEMMAILQGASKVKFINLYKYETLDSAIISNLDSIFNGLLNSTNEVHFSDDELKLLFSKDIFIFRDFYNIISSSVLITIKSINPNNFNPFKEMFNNENTVVLIDDNLINYKLNLNSIIKPTRVYITKSNMYKNNNKITFKQIEEKHEKRI